MKTLEQTLSESGIGGEEILYVDFQQIMKDLGSLESNQLKGYHVLLHRFAKDPAKVHLALDELKKIHEAIEAELIKRQALSKASPIEASEGAPASLSLAEKKPLGYILPDGSGFFKATVPTSEERRREQDAIVQPLKFLPSLKPSRAQEVFTIEDLVKSFKPEMISAGLAVQRKFDGMRLQIHKRGDQVKAFSDSGIEAQGNLPTLVAEVKKLKSESIILDSELEGYVDGKHIGREEISGLVRGPKFDDTIIVANVFDILYLNGKSLVNEPYEKRLSILTGEKIDQKHLITVQTEIVKTAEDLKTAVEKVSTPVASEGAMIKVLSSVYELGGVTSQWIKYKKFMDLHMIVIQKEETRAKGVFTYTVGLRFTPEDKVDPKDIVKVKDKEYLNAGQVFNSNRDVALGTIFTVKMHTFFHYQNPLKVRVYEAKVFEVRPDQTEPDTVQTAITVARNAHLLREKESASLTDEPGSLVTRDLSRNYSRVACALCSAPKNKNVKLGAPRDLWTSNFLQGFFKYCERKNIPYVVMSRKYGFVPEEAKVENYDFFDLNLEEWKLLLEKSAREFGIKEVFFWTRAYLANSDFTKMLQQIEGVKVHIVSNLEDLESHFHDQKTLDAYKQDTGIEVPKENVPQLEAHLSLAEYPSENKTYRFVMQHHYRGKSSHLDFRAEINSMLEGWTLNDQPAGVIKEDVTTVSQARALENKIDWKFTNIPGNKGMKVLAEKKGSQPKDWLSVEGVVEKGGVGATREEFGVFYIIDKGNVEFGVRKSYFHEYFISGNKFQGRFIFRLLPNPYKDQTRSEFIILSWKPQDQTPYILTREAIKSDYIPPKGISSLPKKIRDKIPSEYQYWMKDSPAERKRVLQLLQSDIKSGAVKVAMLQKFEGTEWKDKTPVAEESKIFTQEDCKSKTLDLGDGNYRICGCSGNSYFDIIEKRMVLRDVTFVLQEHYWRGQEVVRGGPSVIHHDLRIDIPDKPGLLHFVLESNPLSNTSVTALEKPNPDKDWMTKGLGEPLYLKPGTPGNDTENTPAWIHVLDKGKVTIYSNESMFKKFGFQGDSLHGVWSFVREKPNVPLWTMSVSEMPQTSSNEVTASLSLSLESFDETKEGLLVKGTAMSPGVWKGVYFSPEAILDRPYRVKGLPVCIEHNRKLVVGYVSAFELKNNDLIVNALVTDPKAIEEIKKGTFKGLSVDVIVSIDPIRKVILSIKEYKEVTLTRSPACYLCLLE